MRGIGCLGLCLIVSITLGLGCDSSSSKGGGGGVEVETTTAAQYTQADLTGVWKVLLSNGEPLFILVIDDIGKLVYVNGVEVPFGGFQRRIKVRPNGRLAGDVRWEVYAGQYWVFDFSKMKFKSKKSIVGTLYIYDLLAGGPPPVKKGVPVTMRRYRY